MSDSIGKLFDGIAGTYDRFNHLLSLNIDRKEEEEARPLTFGITTYYKGDKQ